MLTDGCGRISIAATRTIEKELKLDQTSAFQVRVDGAKGVVLIRLPDEPIVQEASQPSPLPSDADVYIRPSQIKVHCHPRYQNDLAKLTIDIVRPARVKIPTRLSGEAIIIMAWNGVLNRTFIELQNQALKDELSPLINWPDNQPLLELAKAVESLGGVGGARRVRLAGGTKRARGLSSKRWTDDEEVDEDGEDEDADISDRNTLWSPDYLSGCPSSLSETIHTLLVAGHRPESQPYLAGKLKSMLKDLLGRFTGRFQIAVPESLSAIIVPGTFQPMMTRPSLYRATWLMIS